MATFFGSPPFLSHTITRTSNRFSSSSQVPPPRPPSQQPSRQPPPPPPPPPQTPPHTQKLSSTSSGDQPPTPAAAAKVEQQQKITSSKPAATNVESTDWIATSLTRRFGLGAGLAWAGFLAIGVLSEQIKTRLEVSQQEANTRDVEEEEELTLPNGIR